VLLLDTLRMALLVSFLSFLTTIWGEGIVFSWLINLTGISALLVWGSIGLVSLRFRYIWHVQNRPLTDLPYRQPLYPTLPLLIIILSVLMFAAQGYSAVVAEPFEAKVRDLF
jgi:amino acid permease